MGRPPGPPAPAPLTPEALGQGRAAAHGGGQGASLAHALLPIEGHSVSRRKGHPETRDHITSQDPRAPWGSGAPRKAQAITSLGISHRPQAEDTGYSTQATSSPCDLGLVTGVSLGVLVRTSRRNRSEEQRGPAHSTGSVPGTLSPPGPRTRYLYPFHSAVAGTVPEPLLRVGGQVCDRHLARGPHFMAFGRLPESALAPCFLCG